MVIGSNPCHAAESTDNVVSVEVDDGTSKQQDLELGKTFNLKSGILFRDAQIGKGPLVTTMPEGEESSSDTPAKQVKPTIVMHVQALLRDGTILMDTREYGSPLVYRLGSALERMDAPGVVTQGMDDVISSRGTLVGTNGERVEPMRQGGIRRAIVPVDLAYGQGGLSQYQVWKLGKTPLQRPVPRNEVIRYEIEILRCSDIPWQVPSPNQKLQEPIVTTAQVCCPEDLFPCP